MAKKPTILKKQKKIANKAKTVNSAEAISPAPAAESELLHPLISLREQMEDLFDRYFHGLPSLWPHRGRWWDFEADLGLKGFDRTPTMDMSETESGYKITAEMPGMDKKASV